MQIPRRCAGRFRLQRTDIGVDDMSLLPATLGQPIASCGFRSARARRERRDLAKTEVVFLQVQAPATHSFSPAPVTTPVRAQDCAGAGAAHAFAFPSDTAGEPCCWIVCHTPGVLDAFSLGTWWTIAMRIGAQRSIEAEQYAPPHPLRR